ncbi:transmembrane protein 104-like [Ambystoma mexicanum]|uniref:transmembrane protein 104-like n=1 Tax=Ambystoma mexicanum TaxID=8296 RepID=UPI0037E94BA9
MGGIFPSNYPGNTQSAAIRFEMPSYITVTFMIEVMASANAHIIWIRGRDQQDEDIKLAAKPSKAHMDLPSQAKEEHVKENKNQNKSTVKASEGHPDLSKKHKEDDAEEEKDKNKTEKQVSKQDSAMSKDNKEDDAKTKKDQAKWWNCCRKKDSKPSIFDITESTALTDLTEMYFNTVGDALSRIILILSMYGTLAMYSTMVPVSLTELFWDYI